MTKAALVIWSKPAGASKGRWVSFRHAGLLVRKRRLGSEKEVGRSLWVGYPVRVMQARKFDLCTAESYLEDEKSRQVRHEYLGGTVHAMSGASRRHNRIAGAIYRAMEEKIQAGPCEAYIEDVKVHIRTAVSEFFYYPDVMVGCDPTDDQDYYLEKPTIIFEVLSDSTEQIDRREKLLAYQTIGSLQHYVIVSQDKPLVEWVRREGKSWEGISLSGLDEILSFKSVQAELSLAEIYSGVSFDSESK